jgi:3-oxoacyl-[acyl-carrier protein] reductase
LIEIVQKQVEAGELSTADMADAQWRATLAANLDSIFYTTRAAARRVRDGGRIVLVGSTAGQRGEAGHADYAASKGAIIALVKGVAVELAPRGVTVNCVAPGFIETEMTAATAMPVGVPFDEFKKAAAAQIPVQRVGTPDDIAATVSFLVSEESGFVSGQVIYVAGGPRD